MGGRTSGCKTLIRHGTRLTSRRTGMNPHAGGGMTDTRGIERNLYEIARQLAALRAVLERIERRLR